MEFVKDLKFDEKGLIPAVAQDAVSGEILMLAYMNEESIKQTIETGHAVYFSRSRQELWERGAMVAAIFRMWLICMLIVIETL